mgnify:CR=1 FL=1
MKQFFHSIKEKARVLFELFRKKLPDKQKHSAVQEMPAVQNEGAPKIGRTSGTLKEYFRNIKVKQRLIASFLLLAVVSAVLAGIGIYSMWDSNQTEANMQTRMDSITLLQKVQQDILSTQELSSEAVLSAQDIKKDIFDELCQSMNQSKQTYLADQKKLMATVETQEWREKLNTASAAFEGACNGPIKDALRHAQNENNTSACLSLRSADNAISAGTLSVYSDYLNFRIAASNQAYQDNVVRNRQSLILLIILAVAGVALSLLIGVRISDEINAALNSIMKCTDGLAKGNLSVRSTYRSRNEFGVVAASLNQSCEEFEKMIAEVSSLLHGIADGKCDYEAIQDYQGDFKPISEAVNTILNNLNRVMNSIRVSAEQVNSGSQQVADGSQELAQGATEQASSVEELSASISEISAKVNENTEGITKIAGAISIATSAAKSGAKRMDQLLGAMDSISASSQEIAKIIKVIDDIAFQTNILALNASVEAARAGNAGRGFAVVAEEVRNLAGKSADAAKQTAELIGNSSKQVEQGLALSSETAGAFSNITERVSSLNSTIQNIQSASAAQAASIVQITNGIDQVSAVVQTNSATAEESAAASEELSAQANRLQDEIEWVHLREQ